MTPAFEILVAYFPRKTKPASRPFQCRKACFSKRLSFYFLFLANGMACLISSQPNLKSAVLTDSWLKMAPAPQQQQQHQEEPQPWHLHPPLPPPPMPPTTTSMSPKSDDLVASAPLLSPFPPPWRWELATCTVPLHHHSHLIFLYILEDHLFLSYLPESLPFCPFLPCAPND